MTIAFLLLLGVLEYLVFAESFSQFFQGDALFHMEHRFRSWGEFFHGLFHLDVGNWYRPLAGQTIPSIFFHWFGFNPYGYHWVVFLLFFLTTCLVFWFIRELTQSFVAAAAGTAFFSLHSINVYVTYDFAFAPELFYASFYVLSCIAYLRGTVSKRWYALSILFFVLALMSKEAAVTLPANILLLTFFFSAKREKKYLAPFFGIFAVYYLYIVRFLKVGSGDYMIALHKDVSTRLRDSFLWAFNLAPGQMRYAVVAAALFITAYALASLFGPRRRSTLFGLGWFIAALSPMLGIVAFFGPYYLFLPLVGIALIVGECFEWLYTAISRFNPRIALAAVCLGLSPFIVAARLNAQEKLYTDTALGYAGRIAENSAHDLERSHPAIPKGATVYFVNPDTPDLTRFFGISALVRLVYADDSIDVRYSSLGHTISDDLIKSGKLIVMRYANEHLIDGDPNEIISAKPDEDFQYATSDRFKLDVSPTHAAAGSGSYAIRISGVANTDVELQYRFNEGPLAFITVHLNPNGETRFFVSNETKRGSYRFVALRIPPDTTWIRAAGIVTVTD